VITRAICAVLAAMVLAPGSATARSQPDRAGPPPGYSAAAGEVRREGRSLTRLVAAGATDELFARFAPALAQEVPKEALQQLLDETLAAGPVAERVGESALPVGPDRRSYAAEHRWAGAVLHAEFTFRADGHIDSMLLRPAAQLPPDPAAGYRPKARLRLPLAGTWWVYWGGRDELSNYHVAFPPQRHAYDLVQWRRGGTARGAGQRNRDYHAWGRRVVAPADAVVTDVRDGLRDNRPRVETDRDNPAGNHVVLSFGSGEHGLLAHLQEGSVRVRAGERVRAGQPLGRVGNSGNTSEPHLHFHLQDGPDLDDAIGLPVVFRDLVVDGEPRRRSSPVQGRFIARNPGRP
jgi:murein DD-endopeptidase MepM/ murein hydrolase activator NlpD